MASIYILNKKMLTIPLTKPNVRLQKNKNRHPHTHIP
jgi:hypothetical protein